MQASAPVQGRSTGGRKVVEVFAVEQPKKRVKKVVYVVLGNQFGDEGKGKLMRVFLVGTDGRVLARFSIRVNGGPNAGHTIKLIRSDPALWVGPEFVRNDQPIKFATHQLPSGILFGVPGIIGYNCVVDLFKLEKEIAEVAALLCRTVEEVQALLTIAPCAQLITDESIAEDRANNKVGTTGTGIGPTYSKKALRTGTQIGDRTAHYPVPASMPRVLGHNNTNVCTLGAITVAPINGLLESLGEGDVVVIEGAQGIWLDIDLGAYPHVTSSDCTIASACKYGLDLEDMVAAGISKAAMTYVGSKQMEPGFVQNEPHTGNMEMLRLIGQEYGVTTGRRRQVLTLDMDLEIDALHINQCRYWVVNKSDVLEPFQRALDMAKAGTLAEHGETEELKAYGQHLLAHPELIATLPPSAYQFKRGTRVETFTSWTDMKEAIQTVIGQAVKERRLPKLTDILFYDAPESDVDFDAPFSL
jgi:adenylosuccinate synthase